MSPKPESALAVTRRVVDRVYNWGMRRVDRIALPLVDAALDAYARIAPHRLAARIEAGIDGGLRYFEAQPSFTFDAVFTVTLIVNASYEPRLARLHDQVRAYARKWSDPHLRLLDARYDPERAKAAGAVPFDVGTLSEVEQPLVPCIYADRTGLDETFLRTLETVDDEGGYGTTHVWLSALILKRFSSIPVDRLDALIESTIPVVARAQRYACATDIFSERAALLLRFGDADLVRPAWIARILWAEARDGGWRWTRSLWPQRSDQHPTAVALGALILFREKFFRARAGTSRAVPSTIGECFSLAEPAFRAATRA